MMFVRDLQPNLPLCSLGCPTHQHVVCASRECGGISFGGIYFLVQRFEVRLLRMCYLIEVPLDNKVTLPDIAAAAFPIVAACPVAFWCSLLGHHASWDTSLLSSMQSVSPVLLYVRPLLR